MAQSDPNRVINLIYQQTIPISNSTEKQENVGLVLDSMEQLIKMMKQEDPMFACLYQEMAYSGSYWDGLRVKEATEFDLNIVFKLPCQVPTAQKLRFSVTYQILQLYNFSSSWKKDVPRMPDFIWKSLFTN